MHDLDAPRSSEGCEKGSNKPRLGIMGASLAANLHKAGHRIAVYDVRRYAWRVSQSESTSVVIREFFANCF
jgi:hypothetical protein